MHIVCRRGVLDSPPLIMGILNVTPDSFSDGGRWNAVPKALDHAFSMVDLGASIIDVGAESTRPGSDRLSPEDEMSRLEPVLKALLPSVSIPVSIDTMHAETAEMCLRLGADMINDVNGLRNDGMVKVCSDYGAAVVISHMNGTIDDTHGSSMGDDYRIRIKESLYSKCLEAESSGILHNNIIIDPGLGFGKSPDQNMSIAKDCSFLGKEYPVLIGLSRKRFVRQFMPDEDVDVASAMLSAESVRSGASIIRTHDVKVTSEALRTL